VESVAGREDILELRRVCREILVAAHVQEFAVDMVMASTGERTGARERAQVHPLRLFAEGCPGAGRVRTRFGVLDGRFHLSVGTF
jgi:hypothetical protein